VGRGVKKATESRKPADTSGKQRGHGAKSEAIRERAILALLSERSIGAAAQRCAVNERTLRGWLSHDPDFASAYDQARQATFTAGISRIQALTAKAVDTLEELLDAPNPAVRLGAARTVSEIGLHQHDAATILRKLADIEAMQNPRV
jgi:hypothetical protein